MGYKQSAGAAGVGIVSGLCAAVLLGVHAGAGPADPPRPTLTVAIEDYPPFEHMEDGEPAGLNVAVIGQIMQRLNIPVRFQLYPFTRSWLMLTKGTVDAAPSISYQAVREPHLFFTPEQKAFLTTGVIPPDYLWITEYVFFINRRYQKSLRFESYEQVRKDGYRVAVNKEYTYDADFREAGLDTHVFVNPIDAFRALDQGAVDVFPMDLTVGLWLLRQEGLADRATYLPKPLFRKPYLMAFSRHSKYPDIQNVMMRFYGELRRMRDTGEYQTLRDLHIPPTFGTEFPRPLTFVCEHWAPFEYEEEGDLKGIDVEVTDAIMTRLGIPYEIRIYPWSRAWMMVQKGSADAVLSVSYKEGREELLHYTTEQKAFAATGVLPPDYLWLSEYVFFVKRKYAEVLRYESYDQIRSGGYRVGLNKDYSYDETFREAGLGFREYPTTAAGLSALVSEEIDLYPMDKTVGLATLRELGLAESVTFLPKIMFSKPYLAPFCRLSDYPRLPEIMAAFNSELRRMRSNGTYDEILKKYQAPDGSDTE